MDLHSIAHAKLRKVLLELFALNFFDNAHGRKKLEFLRVAQVIPAGKFRFM
jgi:hypothetical protein